MSCAIRKAILLTQKIRQLYPLADYNISTKS